MIRLFFSYSHADETLRDQLAKQMSAMRRQGVIDDWHDRKMLAGDHIDGEIRQMMEQADIVLLLVSPDFIASDYCYDVEMARAVQRHQAGECRTIPVILRPCDWHGTPFGSLLAVPTDGKAVTTWANMDEAFLNVAKAIRKAAEQVRAQKARASGASTPAAPKAVARDANPPPPSVAPAPQPKLKRASGVRATDAERDQFVEAAFEEVARYFQSELATLEATYREVTTSYRRTDSDHFLATVYVQGNARCRGKVWINRGRAMGGIHFSNDQSSGDNSYNESLSIKDEDGELAIQPLGLSMFGQGQEGRLDAPGAAAYLWEVFTRALG